MLQQDENVLAQSEGDKNDTDTLTSAKDDSQLESTLEYCKNHKSDVLDVDSSIQTLVSGFRKLNLNDNKINLKISDFDRLVQYIKSSSCKSIIFMVGAGISVAANIPDFRTPGTGLYSLLGKYNLPFPEAIFSIDYFKINNRPFFDYIKNFISENYQPTDFHRLIRLINDKKLLLRLYTQNIDNLEIKVNLPSKKVVFSHGSFETSTCLECGQEYDLKWLISSLSTSQVVKCKKSNCHGVVKPDITFFGEALPKEFDKFVHDFPKADLLIVAGTSLKVYPFAGLIDQTSPKCVKVLINNKLVKKKRSSLTGLKSGFDWSNPDGKNLKLIGDCQKIALMLVDALGWKEEFYKLKLELAQNTVLDTK